MENQTKLYPSYMGEFYAANPVKLIILSVLAVMSARGLWEYMCVKITLIINKLK